MDIHQNLTMLRVFCSLYCKEEMDRIIIKIFTLIKGVKANQFESFNLEDFIDLFLVESQISGENEEIKRVLKDSFLALVLALAENRKGTLDVFTPYLNKENIPAVLNIARKNLSDALKTKDFMSYHADGLKYFRLATILGNEDAKDLLITHHKGIKQVEPHFLPNDLLGYIFEYLSIADIKTILFVSRKWNEVAQKVIWTRLCIDAKIKFKVKESAKEEFILKQNILSLINPSQGWESITSTSEDRHKNFWSKIPKLELKSPSSLFGDFHLIDGHLLHLNSQRRLSSFDLEGNHAFNLFFSEDNEHVQICISANNIFMFDAKNHLRGYNHTNYRLGPNIYKSGILHYDNNDKVLNKLYKLTEVNQTNKQIERDYILNDFLIFDFDKISESLLGFNITNCNLEYSLVNSKTKLQFPLENIKDFKNSSGFISQKEKKIYFLHNNKKNIFKENNSNNYELFGEINLELLFQFEPTRISMVHLVGNNLFVFFKNEIGLSIKKVNLSKLSEKELQHPMGWLDSEMISTFINAKFDFNLDKIFHNHEEALIFSETDYKNILHLSPDGVDILNINENITPKIKR